MGAIARSAANNITTSGVFTSSAIANTSVTGITTLANASDGITFISSQTASNSASVSFTSGLTSTYKAYKFVFSDIHPRTDFVGFTFNMSTDSGSNYNVTKTTTNFIATHKADDADANLIYQTGRDLAQSTDFQEIIGDCGNGAKKNSGGSLLIFNPSSTTYVKHFISTASTMTYHTADTDTGNYNYAMFVAGYGNTTSAINAVRFQMSSGNFDGSIYLYGIK